MMSRPRVRWLICVTRVVRVVFCLLGARARRLDVVVRRRGTS